MCISDSADLDTNHRLNETPEVNIGCTSQSMGVRVCTVTRGKRKSSMLYVRKHRE